MASNPNASPSARASGLTVLVAEDNPVNQKIMVWRLKKYGITPTIVENGKEAARAVTEGSFDLILMDVKMPDMDGYEATRLIRQHEKDNGLPAAYIAAMTALVMDSDLQACRDAGMNGFLPKPFHVEDLEAILDELKGR